MASTRDTEARRPRVLFSANTAWYLHNFRRSTLQTLIEQGCDVYCATPRDEYTNRLVNLGAVHIDVPMHTHTVSARLTLLTIHHFWTALSKVKPDLVCSFTPKPNILLPWLARLHGAQSIANVSGLGTSAVRPMLRSVLPTLYKVALAPSQCILVQNSRDAALFSAHRIASPSRLRLIPGSGVDLLRFHPRMTAPLRPPGSRRFIMASRLLREKGVLEYLAAAATIKSQFPNATFALAGASHPVDPRYLSAEETERRCHDIGVEWLGAVDEIERHLADADIVVLPTRYNEGTPKVLIEAIALGRLVVASDIPGCREVTDAGRVGLLFEPKDTNSLDAAMQKALEMAPDEAAQMASAARSYAEQEYDELLCIAPYLEAIRTNKRCDVPTRPRFANKESTNE